jgi:hypothetical protein
VGSVPHNGADTFAGMRVASNITADTNIAFFSPSVSAEPLPLKQAERGIGS